MAGKDDGVAAKAPGVMVSNIGAVALGVEPTAWEAAGETICRLVQPEIRLASKKIAGRMKTRRVERGEHRFGTWQDGVGTIFLVKR